MLKNKNYFSTWQTFHRLWPIIFPFRIGLFIAAITLILNAASDTFMLSLLKPLLDDGFGKANKNIFVWMPLAVVSLMGLRGVSGFVSNYCISWVSGKVVMEIRRRLFNHIMGMPVSFFCKQSIGTLLSRITYDSEQVASSSSNALIIIVRESASIIGLSIMMFYYSWQLSLIIVVIAPIVSFIIKLVSNKFRRISNKMQNAMGQLTSSAEQMLKGHKEVLIFGGQQTENKHFSYISNQIRQQNMKMVAVSSIFDPIVQLIASLALAFVLYVASIPKVMEILTAGSITVIFSSMIVLMKPLKSLTNVNAQFQRGMSACQTLFSILDMATEKDNGMIKINRVRGNLTFKNVTFYYPNKHTPSLYNINFTVSTGHTVALVGKSGSGKSTIANLLTRFYNVHQGEILLDNININEYKLSSLRNQIAFVSQNVHLFNDTIANNIAYAYKNCYVDRIKIENVAYMAGIMDFIGQMEHGLDTIIGENGILLSGGQRQRIAIARALLRDCPIFVLDEATSALDPEAERAIQKVFSKLKNNKTLLIIAHRFSTIEKADEILVIENGCIVERGTHAYLIDSRGIYAQLHRLQFN
ncbi:lipid A ABC transporter ATP-binding protein/permease MsbA [Blochmannia endosymbiont of Camponotus (Colobopsis) obliquus]|uniref:lipid A ABC transporter ATP-binding protein/permease MsbA n=1 Tax=Blochmannia endosymbiont of Camponotus (Colobopsis) obliquus TaxID=1505597 RepID=UPI00061A721D|nr:lipid A ABC transporter ATP-binding protein/permease MsbA [Blochmannia endosymbiont of Camponotus (Colobopsis) obliquus]AKC60538.1 Lipid A export ATP-binding/permease protein MsbA [Blochmannia endosymbiont of Camponotus (Colobopsis) obliquus]